MRQVGTSGNVTYGNIAEVTYPCYFLYLLITIIDTILVYVTITRINTSNRQLLNREMAEDCIPETQNLIR